MRPRGRACAGKQGGKGGKGAVCMCVCCLCVLAGSQGSKVNWCSKCVRLEYECVAKDALVCIAVGVPVQTIAGGEGALTLRFVVKLLCVSRVEYRAQFGRVSEKEVRVQAGTRRPGRHICECTTSERMRVLLAISLSCAY